MIGKIFFLVIATMLSLPTTTITSDATQLQSSQFPSQMRLAPVLRYKNLSVGMAVTAKSAMVLDLESQAVLFEKNIYEQLPIASITKLMTAIVVLDQKPDLNQLVTMQSQDEVSNAKYLYRGDKVTIKDLINVGLVGSDNNAIQALVRVSGFSKNEFIQQLNNKARILQMVDTNFSDPTGLSKENVSTAQDLMILAQVAWSIPEIRAASGKAEYYLKVKNTGRSQYIPHTNKLYNSFINIEASKTGFTNEAGYCLLSLVTNEDNKQILVLVLGSPEENDRFQDSKALAWWTYENYHWPELDDNK